MLKVNQPSVDTCRYKNQASASDAETPASCHALRHCLRHTRMRNAAVGALTKVYFTKIATTHGTEASHARFCAHKKVSTPTSVNSTPKKSTRSTGIHEVTTAMHKYAALNNKDGSQLRVVRQVMAPISSAVISAANQTATRAGWKRTPKCVMSGPRQ